MLRENQNKSVGFITPNQVDLIFLKATNKKTNNENEDINRKTPVKTRNKSFVQENYCLNNEMNFN